MNQSKLFGKRVRTVRRAAKITQEEAAEAAHLNPKYIGEIERGEKRPSFEAVMALAKALSVSPETFFQFDREESDEKALRKRIEALLKEANLQQLRQVQKLLKVFLEP
jgi:transcriptional regulator with XRE-family HTH domain